MVPWVFTGIFISALRKSASLYFCTWSTCFSFRETFLESFLLLLYGSEHSFQITYGEKGSFLHMCKEKRNTSRLLYRNISLVFSTRGTLYLRPYYLSVLSLSFNLQYHNGLTDDIYNSYVLNYKLKRLYSIQKRKHIFIEIVV